MVFHGKNVYKAFIDSSDSLSYWTICTLKELWLCGQS